MTNKNELHVLRDEEICARCSRKTGGCCIADPAFVSNCFPLSLPEVLRLLPYADLADSPRLAPALPESMVIRIRAGVVEETQERPETGDKESKKVTGLHLAYDEGKDDRSRDELSATASKVVAAEPTTEEFVAIMAAVLPEHAGKMKTLFPVGEYHFRLRTLGSGACALLGPTGCRIPRDVRPWYCQSYPGWLCRGELTLLMDDNCLVAREAGTPLRGIAKLGMAVSDIRHFHHEMLRDWKLVP